MSGVQFQKANGRFIVSGNTYPIKTQLKQIGMRWYAPGKYWQTTDTSDYMANQIQRLIGPQEPSRIGFSTQEDEVLSASVGGVKVHFEGEDDDQPYQTRSAPKQYRSKTQPRRPVVYPPVVREEVFVNQDSAIQVEVYQSDQNSWW